MVGTIEPRKSHAQALSAFGALWKRGNNANLVIVGRQGWMVEPLMKQFREHPEFERRLFWTENASDDDLQALYQASTGVLMASVGEGFGLPLVEAARNHRPILARDIPVFREVAGANATYFSGHSAEKLANALEAWLVAVRDGSAPSSAGLKLLTWDESIRWLTDIILGDHWYCEWRCGGVTSALADEATPSSAGASFKPTYQAERARAAPVPASRQRL
jgi:glycosyltransferase involved in cell wall biosynthesis